MRKYKSPTLRLMVVQFAPNGRKTEKVSLKETTVPSFRRRHAGLQAGRHSRGHNHTPSSWHTSDCLCVGRGNGAEGSLRRHTTIASHTRVPVPYFDLFATGAGECGAVITKAECSDVCPVAGSSHVTWSYNFWLLLGEVKACRIKAVVWKQGYKLINQSKQL